MYRSSGSKALSLLDGEVIIETLPSRPVRAHHDPLDSFLGGYSLGDTWGLRADPSLAFSEEDNRGRRTHHR